MSVLGKATWIALVSLIATSANAQAKADFGALAMCAKLGKMPAGYKPIDCNKRHPLRECSFSLPKDKIPVKYLVSDGIVVSKWVEFGTHTASAGPFGLKSGDTEKSALSKARKATGLVFEAWSDEEPGSTYHQSTDIACQGNLYNLRLFFRDGRLDMVSVSSLPMT